MVDIEKGAFGGSVQLDGSDHNAHDEPNTSPNVFRISGVGPGKWFEGDLTSFASQMNNNGYTQFRIYFPDGSTPGKYIGWYSGDSAYDEPQLIVRYQE